MRKRRARKEFFWLERPPRVSFWRHRGGRYDLEIETERRIEGKEKREPTDTAVKRRVGVTGATDQLGESFGMSMYWIYDFPNAQLAMLTVASFVGVSLLGLFASRPLTRRLLKSSPVHNDIVSFFFAGVGVFYGLALGLIAVATWENFTEIDGLISKEAAALAGFYRDLDGYPEPLRSRLESKLRDYTQFVIEKEWPAHHRGEAPETGTLMLDVIENEIMAFEPANERQKIAHAEAMRSHEAVLEQRRMRLQSVGTGLPASLWSVVMIGACLTIMLTYLFWVENLALHALLIALLAAFIALLVFLTAAMDNPFRGEFSVSAEAFQVVLNEVMMQSGKSLAP